jgi:hypothetical protein
MGGCASDGAAFFLQKTRKNLHDCKNYATFAA